ncbi:hypothetical protein GGF45_000962 [Coemansia sp. RSA 551]|nr:hypothetical protein GGF45_000962 [Coemansia sp. RSA 551]KAJ2248550.1 hypothetical protein GGH97_001695 [Coemansia sp. RSA 475]
MTCMQSLPLRRSWVYSHVPLNTCILVRCVFGEPYTQMAGGKNTIDANINIYWSRAVDLNRRMFRPHAHHTFKGVVYTDGVSISTVRESVNAEPTNNTTRKRKWGRPRQQQPLQLPQQTQTVQQPQQQADCAYIHNLPQTTLQNTAGRCVLVDPGRRDMLYMLHENSTVEDKCMYRYTHSQQRKEMRVTKHKRIREREKTAEVVTAERRLRAGSYVVPNLQLFEEYLRARADVAVGLTQHYNETKCRQRDGATTPGVPLHRKLRLSAYINRQQADQLLVNRLRAKFKPMESDPEPIFIMGNWGAPMTRFHEPIRGKGWRRLLKHAGFEVYLIDEHRTSSLCPNCEEHISTFLDVPNPRPWMRPRRPIVKCHGLLACESKPCVQFRGNYLGESEGDVKRRLWNRDLVAVLNFRHILQSLRETGTVPTRFQRQQQTTEAAPAP